MHACGWFILISVILLCAVPHEALPASNMGEIVRVSKDSVVACFPAPVRPRSMMIVYSGEGESVAGLAISDRCYGDGPFSVTGKLTFVLDPLAVVPGKKVAVNPANMMAVPSPRTPPDVAHAAPARPRGGPVDQDLKLYYYAAGQTVGYGALGIGYERTIKVVQGLGLELDGGITAVGNLATSRPDTLNTDQLIKSASGRVKLDFAPGFGFYSGFRWSAARGDQERWDRLASQVGERQFSAPSVYDEGTVVLQGVEYGLNFRPLNRLTLTAGYIPKLRADYGSFGVLDNPGYTAELRFATKKGAVRLRGLTTDGYWVADLGITIR